MTIGQVRESAQWWPHVHEPHANEGLSVRLRSVLPIIDKPCAERQWRRKSTSPK